MGVSGLWAEIKPVATRQSFEKTALAVFDEAYEALQDGQPIEKGTTLGLRVGIDASAWFIHSEKSEGGANPALRNMFHRVIRLSRAGVRALFVFDGPHRPSVKRGHRVYRGVHSIQKDFERIVEAFGFEWRTAPGEAEAELAYLNRRGMLDLVITDDVDCLLFGASTLMKHALINQVTDSIYPQLFERGSIELELDLTVSGLVLVALMSGGDYDTGGLTGIGPKISIALAKAGYGERLQIIMTESSGKTLQDDLQAFRDEIRHEMRTNESGMFERKAGAVANKFHDHWPDIAVANSYYNAITSEAKKYRHFDKPHLWSRKIDVPALVGIMDDLFEFVHAEILQKLRSQIWECMVVQDLIWSIRDNGIAISDSPAGSPSKVLAASLGSVSLGNSIRSRDVASETGIVPHRIDKKRSPPKKAENHVTDELQLIVDPIPAATTAKQHLKHPDPNVGKLEARKEAEAATICALHGPEHPGAIPAPPRNAHYDNPNDVQKMWIQESLLRMAVPDMVRLWEEREQAKLDAKASKLKGKKAADKKSPRKSKQTSQGAESSTPPKVHRKPTKAKKKAVVDSESEPEDLFAPSQPSSKDVFSSSMVPSTSASGSQDSLASRADSGRPALPPPIAPASYKRSKDRDVEMPSSSSDSDVQLVSASKVAARKSPRKSPRKDASQTTARGDTATRSGPSLLPFNAVKKGADIPPAVSNKADPTRKGKAHSVAPRKHYSYRDLVDSDSESSGGDLPPLTQLLKAKEKNGHQLKHSSTAASSSAMARSSSSGVSQTQAKGGKQSARSMSQGTTATQPRGPPLPSQIIDLCSSD